MLAKIDDCDENSLNTLSDDVASIANVHVFSFRVSTRKKVLKYAEWDKLNVWTKETLKQELIKRRTKENGVLTDLIEFILDFGTMVRRALNM